MKLQSIDDATSENKGESAGFENEHGKPVVLQESNIA